MKPRYIITLILLLAGVSGLYAKRLRGLVTVPENTAITFVADSVDYRSDLTRLYGRVVGRPHTSHRIDGVSITVGGQEYESTDIDGVDFKRYFQWEDDGEIPLEIDFPAIKTPTRKFVVEFNTVRGNSRNRIK